ncbi:hypothetical protein [Bradyrhizobium sp. WSM4349]|uniref:hypothetical protein n=1 Tax=Bradyrhizobium sp. WSM4349 TaxID=1040988 RepID=UPI0003768175|nr:hypothetical protein [Bradyrhizobium sp. WSM4349]
MTIPVRWRDVPYVGTPQCYAAPSGSSIAEIVARTPDLPIGFDRAGEVRINGVVVPREQWRWVRPRVSPGREIVVTLHMPLQGGGGLKNIFRIVAMVALLVTATVISGGALTPILGPLFAAGSIGASVAAAAVTIGGSLVIAALTPPPSAGAIASSANAQDASQLISSSLTGNTLQPGASVPRVVGTMKVYPPLISLPRIEVVGDQEIAEAIYGLAGPHKIEDIRIGDVPIAQIPGVDWEIREGWPGDPDLALVTKQARADTPQVDLLAQDVDSVFTTRLTDQVNPANCMPEWYPVVSRIDPDEIALDVTWGQGLVSQSDPTAAIALPLRIRMRKRGTTDWLNLPEIHVRNAGVKPFRKSIRFRFGVQAPTTPVAPAFGDQPFAAYVSVPTQNIDPIGSGGWQAHSYFYSGSSDTYLAPTNYITTGVRNVSIYKDRVEFYFFNTADFTKGTWEIEVIRGFPYNLSSFEISTYILTSGGTEGTHIYDFFGYRKDSDGYWGIPVILNKITNATNLSRVTSIWNEHPIKTRDFAMVAIRGSGRQFEQLSVVASGYVRDYDGAGWEAWTTTSNPAPHLRDVLSGDLGAAPLPIDLMDDIDLVDFRSHCDAMGYEVNAVIDGLSMWDAATLIASAGYARPRQSEKWGVMIDRDRSSDAPIQIFSPRNLSGFGFEIAFAQRPSGFRVRFSDKDDNYREREIIVLDPEATADRGDYEDIRYDGLVTEAEARNRALFDLAQARRRFKFYSADADSEALLVCRRGDLVGVQHDVLARQVGFSRIVAKVMDVGTPTLVAGLLLDGSVPALADDAWSAPDDAWALFGSAWADGRYGVAIRLNNGAVLVKEVSGLDPETNTLTFAVPFADPSNLFGHDSLVVTGPLGQEYRRLIVFDVAPKSEERCHITFVDEAPELWAA